MLNLTIAGNLGNAAETRTSNDGRQFLTFSVACRTGKDETQWVSVTSTQVNLAQCLTKGQKVVVIGNLKLTEKDGKAYLNLSANNIALMGSNQSGDTSDKVNPSNNSTPSTNNPKAASNDDDLPF